MSKATLIEKVSSARLPKHELNKDNNRHARENGRKDHMASTLHKLPATKECQEQEKKVFPREEPTMWYPIPNGQPALKTYKEHTD